MKFSLLSYLILLSSICIEIESTTNALQWLYEKFFKKRKFHWILIYPKKDTPLPPEILSNAVYPNPPPPKVTTFKGPRTRRYDMIPSSFADKTRRVNLDTPERYRKTTTTRLQPSNKFFLLPTLISSINSIRSNNFPPSSSLHPQKIIPHLFTFGSYLFNLLPTQAYLPNRLQNSVLRHSKNLQRLMMAKLNPTPESYSSGSNNFPISNFRNIPKPNQPQLQNLQQFTFNEYYPSGRVHPQNEKEQEQVLEMNNRQPPAENEFVSYNDMASQDWSQSTNRRVNFPDSESVRTNKYTSFGYPRDYTSSPNQQQQQQQISVQNSQDILPSAMETDEFQSRDFQIPSNSQGFAPSNNYRTNYPSQRLPELYPM